MLNATIGIASSGDNTVITGVSGKSIRIYRILLTNSVITAQSVTLKDGASTNLTGTIQLPLVIGGGPGMIEAAGGELWRLEAGNSFVINLGAATNVAGFVQYLIT